jgi:uncharacterized membrane protein
MDEGRNVCLIFPQLIELEGSSDEQREQRGAFKPTYVHAMLPSTMILTLLIDVISSTRAVCWIFQMVSPNGEAWRIPVISSMTTEI